MNQTQAAPVIHSEIEYRSVIKTLDNGKKPSFLLRLLMNALESYRQSRKMGWSRPQNKYGLNVFCTFRLDRATDRTLIDLAMEAFLEEFTELEEESIQYVRELHQDPHLMGFIFVHDFLDQGAKYEGVTFSFGRIAPGQTRHRDRFDLILESQVTNGVSQGLSRIRTYVDPFRLPIKKNPARFLSHEPPQSRQVQPLFQEGSELYHRWQGETDRFWEHWTQRYIDYFGPRTETVGSSFFPTALEQRSGSEGLVEAGELAS